MQNVTRKTFLKTLGTSAVALGMPAVASADRSMPLNHSLNLGLASYSTRKYSLDETISMCNRLGIKHLALKSMHLPLESSDEQIKSVASKVKNAGIDLYGVGVIYMKSAEEVENAFRYAAAGNIKVIIGVPNHDLLPLVESKVKATNIKLAIHNHGPGDEVYPSPDSVYEKIKLLDSRIGLCIDIGHTVRIGQDPVEKIKKYSKRLFDLHIKDVNKAEADGITLELGRGVIDIPAVLKALAKVKYNGVLGLEYEKDPDDIIYGLSESVGYARGVLATF